MKRFYILTLALTLAAAAQSQTPHVPLTAETRVTTNKDGTVQAQTIERVQLKNGSFTDFRKTTSVTRETKPGCAETTETITQPGQTTQRTITCEKTANGETVRINEVSRNSFGRDFGQRRIEQTAQREADGSTSVRIVEHGADPHGQLALQREEQRLIRDLNPTRTIVESQIRSYDNLRGRFDLTAIQTTEICKQGNTTSSNSTIRRTVGDQDRVVGRVLSTETKTSDGAVQRETVEYGRGLYEKLSYPTTGELKPQRKIVERTVQTSDGAIRLTREVFRLDVNGDWKPVPYNPEAVQP